MHILFFTDNFPPETNAPASRTHEHTKRWAACGHQVTVVTTAPNFPGGKVFAGYRNRLWSRETKDGVNVIRLWTFVTANEGILRRSFDYASFMASIIPAIPFLPRPDVVISTSPQFFTPCAAYVVSRAFRCPWIFELRDLWPDSIVAVGAMKENALIRVLRQLEYFLYRKSTRIVSVTRSFQTVLSGNGIPADKIAVIPNGAELDMYVPGPKPAHLLDRFRLNGKFVAAYVGTIGMAHGLGTLLEAAERLRNRPDIAIVLVGTGAEERVIKAAAQRRGLGNLRFAGSVTKAEVREYWRVCDAALVLLRDSALFRHVLPSKMFEAMSTGRPIILGVRGESEEILREAKAGICIPPEDAKALVDAILRLADGAQEAKAMGEAGRAYVLRNYDRDVLAKEMLNVIEETAAPRVALA